MRVPTGFLVTSIGSRITIRMQNGLGMPAGEIRNDARAWRDHLEEHEDGIYAESWRAAGL